jgi:hypothetical protein
MEIFSRPGREHLLLRGSEEASQGELKARRLPADQATTAIHRDAMGRGFANKATPDRTKIIRTHPAAARRRSSSALTRWSTRPEGEGLPLMANEVLVAPETIF